MLRNFAAALLATTLIAGPAFAAQPSADVGSKPATVTAPAATSAAPAKQANATKPVKTVKHARMHARHHVARAKIGKARSVKVAHFGKVTHQKHASHIAKPGNAGKSNKA
jgi:hypothetical protein